MIPRRNIALCNKIVACLLVLLSLIIFGCATRPESQESTEINVSSNELNIIETCRKNLSIASPDTLRAVIRLLSESDAGKSEAGVEYAYVAAELMSRVYPVVMGGLSIPSAPVGSIYPSLFSDIESGVMPEINQEDISFITGLIVSTAVLYTDDKNVELLSLEYMNQAIQMNERSVLPLYLRGLVSERNGRYDEALADFSRALELDPSCYPAELGTAGIYLKTGQQDAAVEIMDMLSAQYPYSVDVLITAAEARFRINDYNGALEYSTEALRIVPDDPSILLLRAEIFLEQENLQQASRLIEVLQRLNSTEEEYYLVKSEIERTAGDILSALNTLEEARSNHPGSKRIEEAYGAVLMLSGRREEAREILTGEGGAERTGSEGLIVLIEDAVEMEDWKAAEEYASRLMDSDSSLKAGITSWQVWYLQEDFTAALGIAESLYENYPDSTEAAITYIRTLLSLNRRLQAERIIAGKIPTEKDAEKRSELYYLKSLTDDREEEQLQSLRSALFENLQNVEALVRISALYTEMGDIRKAYRYIKQAAAIAPGNPDIKVQMSELEEQLQ